MATEVIMPKVDMVMDAGTFVEWLKQEGDTVEKGDPLFIVLTDKANIEIEAPAGGILAGISARPDDVIPIGQPIAYILQPGESLPSESPAPAPAPPAAAPPSVQTAETPPEPASPPPAAPVFGKVRATPAARHLAADLNLTLSQIPGSGSRGRIHKNDVLRFAEAQPEIKTPVPPPVAPAAAVPLPNARRKGSLPLTGPRRIVAERMAYSAFTAPHFTLSLQADMTQAAKLRARIKKKLPSQNGRAPSFTAITARAVAAALTRHPLLNASLSGEEIILWEDVHLGIAVSLDDYLIVPVIKDAHIKNLTQLAADLNDLVERARAKRLTPAEMSGSTFTISNLGMFGIEAFTAIINPPEAAILAVGKITETPVGVKGKIKLRPMMSLTLSIDHRIVDGATGAAFLADLKTVLENPYLLI